MRSTLAIARRDLAAAFATPLGWLLPAASALLCGVVFMSVGFRNGEPANLRGVLVALGWATVLLAPAVAMRSLAEERRSGTLELLAAAPVRESAIVLGKFLAAMGLLATLLLPAMALAIPLELHGSPDFGELACGLLGLLLVGGSIVALGILASSAVSSQLLAYLATMMPCLGLVLAVKLLPSWSPPSLAAALRETDPLRRLDAFVIGLFDSGNAAYFVAAAAACLALATLCLSRPRMAPASGAARPGRWLHTAARVAAVAALAVGAVRLLSTEPLRIRLDLTRTRAYALSPETVSLLANLPEGTWAIDLLVVPGEGDSAMLRQVDEVLRRFEAARPGLRTGRIDPADPADLAAYERLLASLEAAFATETAAFAREVEAAHADLDRLESFAAARLPTTTASLEGMPAEDPRREPLAAVASLFEQILATGPRLAGEIRGLLETSASRPFPDWEGARSALAAHHRLRSDQLATGLPRDADAVAVAQSLRDSMDRLERLPPLGLDEIARAVASGEAAVVTGPGGAASIPGWQLFPAVAQGDDEGVRFDRRFRGEQLLAAAIRGLGQDAPPMVVFLHSEPLSLLSRREGGGDLAAVADELRASGFEVREWGVGSTAPPLLRPGQRAAWVVLPPLRRTSLETSPRERALIDEARRLLEQGEPLVLSMAPSVLPLVGQRDPWASLLEPLGVTADTSRVVLELPEGERDREVRSLHATRDAAEAHPLGRALAERSVAVAYPVPLTADDAATARIEAVLSLPPSPRRWVEEDWRRLREAAEVPARKRQDAAMPLVLAIERAMPGESRTQRVLAVASSAWMLSSLADLAVSLGGERFAWAHPGNRELMRAGAAWLVGLDEWVAAGGGGEIARLGGIGPEVRRTWGVLLLAVLPLLPLLAGGLVLWRRDRAA